MDRYEKRTAEMVLTVNEAMAGYRPVLAGDRFEIRLGSDLASFAVTDASEPDAAGSVSLTLTEIS